VLTWQAPLAINKYHSGLYAHYKNSYIDLLNRTYPRLESRYPKLERQALIGTERFGVQIASTRTSKGGAASHPQD